MAKCKAIEELTPYSLYSSQFSNLKYCYEELSLSFNMVYPYYNIRVYRNRPGSRSDAQPPREHGISICWSLSRGRATAVEEFHPSLTLSFVVIPEEEYGKQMTLDRVGIISQMARLNVEVSDPSRFHHNPGKLFSWERAR